jgi:hypothetical protein
MPTVKEWIETLRALGGPTRDWDKLMAKFEAAKSLDLSIKAVQAMLETFLNKAYNSVPGNVLFVNMGMEKTLRALRRAAKRPKH